MLLAGNSCREIALAKQANAGKLVKGVCQISFSMIWGRIQKTVFLQMNDWQVASYKLFSICAGNVTKAGICQHQKIHQADMAISVYSYTGSSPMCPHWLMCPQSSQSPFHKWSKPRFTRSAWLILLSTCWQAFDFFHAASQSAAFPLNSDLNLSLASP